MQKEGSMKKLLCLLVTLLLCVSAVGCGPYSKAIEEIKKEQEEEEKARNVTYDGMCYYRYGAGENAEFVSGPLCSDVIKDVHYISWSVNGAPVTRLGFNSPVHSYTDPFYTETQMTAHLYCPGSITNVMEKYLKPHASYQENVNVYYCGTVVDLRVLGYGKNIVYYVPAGQLDEYKTLWQTQTDFFMGTDYPGEVRAANVEYHLNAEDVGDFYYVDYVIPGNQIQNVPPNPSRAGWAFEGWYLEDGETEWDETAQVPEDGVKLYAKWIR